MALVQDQASPEAQVRQQLLQLAGAPGATGEAGGTDRPLKDATLLALYQRFPHYVRGPFRGRLTPSVKQPRTALLKGAMEQQDDELIDLLASHLSRVPAAFGRHSADRWSKAGGELLRWPGARRHQPGQPRGAYPEARARRARCNPCAQIERTNPLARALFAQVRAAAQSSPQTVAELLGAPDRQILSLGLDALARDRRAAPRRWSKQTSTCCSNCWHARVIGPAVKARAERVACSRHAAVGATGAAHVRETPGRRSCRRAARGVRGAGWRAAAAFSGAAHAWRAAGRLPQASRVKRSKPRRMPRPERRPARQVRLTSPPPAAIKAAGRAAVTATSQQVPGVSPGWRDERITSPRLPARHARGDHETRASQVVGRSALPSRAPGMSAASSRRQSATRGIWLCAPLRRCGRGKGHYGPV